MKVLAGQQYNKTSKVLSTAVQGTLQPLKRWWNPWRGRQRRVCRSKRLFARKALPQKLCTGV